MPVEDLPIAFKTDLGVSLTNEGVLVPKALLVKIGKV
jgi:hypothetical protein